MIYLISTPEYADPVSPSIICRWVATESPNNFRLHRRDYDIVSAANNAGFLRITVAAGTYDGFAANSISVYNKTLNAMYTGIVQAGSTTTLIDTDIPFITGFDPSDTALDTDRLITYFNDNTLHAGYYFEGQLTINGIVHPLTIIASPDTFGYADLDVSGILRIIISLGKAGNYTLPLVKESNKSGNFLFEYRECWYASLTTSPPEYELEPHVWYYAECVRSEEQGSNLHEYVPNAIQDAPFLNLFDQPVYFIGLPFDISFILPEIAEVSPISDIHIQMITYNSSNIILDTIDQYVAVDALEGFVNSVLINPATIATGAVYFTIEIITA